jgi:hypothetical protein
MTDQPESRRRAFIRTSALAARALTLPRFSIAQSAPSSSRKLGLPSSAPAAWAAMRS